jgi:opacity protein-like surface antigen
MRHRITFLILGALLAAAPAVHAQEHSPVRWSIFGGFNDPVGQTGNILNTGWNFGFGVTFREPGKPLGIRLDFDYAGHNASASFVNTVNKSACTPLNTGLCINGGYANIWSASANLEFQHLFTNTMYGYAIAGIGAYYTDFSLTEYGYGYVCNPWWYYCYIGTGNVIVASRSGTHFGWNAGAGVSFRLEGGSSLFLEARYTWVDTPQQSFEYIPVVIGLKF